MKRKALGAIKGTLKALAHGLAGAALVLIVVFVVYLENRPDLKAWHHADLDAEFTAKSPVSSLEDYLALEARLFTQLDEEVRAKLEPEDRSAINRFNQGSLSDPQRWPDDWNRTFEMTSAKPKAGVLLLHGMSDSPYSLRTLGEDLHRAGAWVLGLRLPGHGTAPSGLVAIRWQDMAAAVEIGMRHLRAKVGSRPIYIVGYSNGGALAVLYAQAALQDPELPKAAGLVLVSPAIGVTALAAFAVWQARLGHLLGLDKLAWSAIQPEFDPFKYGSFAVNAGDVVYRLTAEIQSRFEALAGSAALERFPPVLAFASAVDATVSTPALVQGLFARLPVGGHELVLFDINRETNIETLLVDDPKPGLAAMLDQPNLAFALSVIANRNEASREVVVRHKKPGESETTETALGLAWPEDLYSLSHIALPFTKEDPLYGIGEPNGIELRLGGLALRGERGVLQVSATDMLRLRWNPFYSYLEGRVFAFLGLAQD